MAPRLFPIAKPANLINFTIEPTAHTAKCNEFTLNVGDQVMPKETHFYAIMKTLISTADKEIDYFDLATLVNKYKINDLLEDKQNAKPMSQDIDYKDVRLQKRRKQLIACAQALQAMPHQINVKHPLPKIVLHATRSSSLGGFRLGINVNAGKGANVFGKGFYTSPFLLGTYKSTDNKKKAMELIYQWAWHGEDLTLENLAEIYQKDRPVVLVIQTKRATFGISTKMAPEMPQRQTIQKSGIFDFLERNDEICWIKSDNIAIHDKLEFSVDELKKYGEERGYLE